MRVIGFDEEKEIPTKRESIELKANIKV